jgi:hypothetical protein
VVLVELGFQPAFSAGDLDATTLALAGHAKSVLSQTLRHSVIRRSPAFVAGAQERRVVLLVRANFAADVNRVRVVAGKAAPLSIEIEE